MECEIAHGLKQWVLWGCVHRSRLKTPAAGAYELSVLPQVEHFCTLDPRSNAGAELGKNAERRQWVVKNPPAVSVWNNWKNTVDTPHQKSHLVQNDSEKHDHLNGHLRGAGSRPQSHSISWRRERQTTRSLSWHMAWFPVIRSFKTPEGNSER